MIEQALADPVPHNLRFVHGDISRLEQVTDGRFGGAPQEAKPSGLGF